MTNRHVLCWRGRSVMTALFTCAFATAASMVLLGYCPKPTPKACSSFFTSDVVFRGTVVSERPASDPDDPEGIARYWYDLKVKQMLRGGARDTVRVFTTNTTSRRRLTVGKEYVLFASYSGPDLEISDDCGPLMDPSQVAQTLRRIAALSKAKSAFVEGAIEGGLAGVQITIAGAQRTYTVASDDSGRFRVSVAPGTYAIRVDPRVAVQAFPYNSIDLDRVTLVRGQCAQLEFVPHLPESTVK